MYVFERLVGFAIPQATHEYVMIKASRMFSVVFIQPIDITSRLTVC